VGNKKGKAFGLCLTEQEKKELLGDYLQCNKTPCSEKYLSLGIFVEMMESLPLEIIRSI
jgi:hypothetical protein